MISDTYKQLNADLHASKPSYGVSGKAYAGEVRTLAREYGCKTILDFGCGKATLSKALKWSFLTVHNYDPAIPEYAELPPQCDLVVCTDVLEHVEPEYLSTVLYNLMTVTNKVAFFAIATRPAKKTLADGRNAHLIQQTAEWWMTQLKQYFNIVRFWGDKGELYAVLRKEP